MLVKSEQVATNTRIGVWGHRIKSNEKNFALNPLKRPGVPKPSRQNASSFPFNLSAADLKKPLLYL